MKEIIRNYLKKVYNMFFNKKNQIIKELNSIKKEQQIIKEELTRTKINQDKERLDLGAVARQTMLAKWLAIDNNCREKEKPDDILICDICGYSQPRKKYKTKSTECIFNGGHLVRYVCPKCGVIFGPSKFREQGQRGIDEDYWVHYLGFNEGDSTEKEIRAFFALNPDKEKIYLNYGCGKWSKSLERLREQGYHVWGYDPYAASDNPYIITKPDELMKIRFNGIYSNDLLEHCLDPIADLIFMKKLLIGFDSKMSHSTSCFRYKYEYTRFHTHFFEGNSVNIMCERAKLKILSKIDDLEQNDFFCYVLGPIDNITEDLKSLMIINEKDKIIFGPYISLPAGRYCLSINLLSEISNIEICITSDCGKRVLGHYKALPGANLINFELQEIITKDIEFVIRGITCTILNIAIKKE